MLTAAPFDRHMPINRGMTYEQMLDAVETQPVHVIEATLDDDTSGLYCEAVQTIIIDEHMTDVQKRCSLTHELFHWLHADDSHAEYGKSHAEWRVRRETAMFLIDPADYVQAEREYDGEIYQMSFDVLPCLKAWDSSINAMLLVRASKRLRFQRYVRLERLAPCFHARPRPCRI